MRVIISAVVTLFSHFQALAIGIGSQSFGDDSGASTSDPIGGIVLVLILVAALIRLGPWKFLGVAATAALMVCAAMAPLLVIATVMGFFNGGLNKNVLIMTGASLAAAAIMGVALRTKSKSKLGEKKNQSED